MFANHESWRETLDTCCPQIMNYSLQCPREGTWQRMRKMLDNAHPKLDMKAANASTLSHVEMIPEAQR